jgi:hypothetical protein
MAWNLHHCHLCMSVNHHPSYGESKATNKPTITSPIQCRTIDRGCHTLQSTPLPDLQSFTHIHNTYMHPYIHMGVYQSLSCTDISSHILSNHKIMWGGGGIAANAHHQNSFPVPTEFDTITVMSTSVDRNHEWLTILSSVKINTYMDSNFKQWQPKTILQYRRSSHPLCASLPPNITSKIK